MSTENRRAGEYQVAGDHYLQPEGVPEHWDLVDLYGWDYFEGQVIKYVMRWRKKNGLEDLRKAAHYLQKYIEIQEEKTVVEESLENSDD